MAWPVIYKGSSKNKLNMPDYERARAGFEWAAAAALDGLPHGAGLNAAYEAVDRHAVAGRGEQVALRCLGGSGGDDITYRELADRSGRVAALLTRLGIEPGDTAAVLLGRGAHLHVAALGILKARAVLCPLFSALGPEPVRARLALGAARVLFTTADLYLRKLAGMRHLLPELREVLIVDAAGAPPEGCRDLAVELATVQGEWTVPATSRDDPALLHFTSGTTGAPKGALHGHGAIEGQAATARMVLDLKPGDIFWCTADPGWVTHTVYGMLAPLAVGATCVVDAEPLDAGRWYKILAEHKVTVFYTTPTAIHMLMRFGAALARSFHVKALRLAASVGEPLNAEAVLWGREALGVPFHDTWWQTETGAVTIANFPSMDIKPGSMGRAVPGVDVAIVRRTATGVETVTRPEEVGEIAIRRGPPSLFQRYIGPPARTEACMVGDWYMTGDLARRDSDGYVWFVGRQDDLIKSSGHLIGPFEIESVLMDHPAVAEAGVIGRPDPLVNEVVAAFVTLNPGFEEGEALRRELLGFAREQLGSALAPRELAFVRELPKTNSGKIMRRVLRLRDLGVAEGDAAVPLPG